jgi:hypothetical protein
MGLSEMKVNVIHSFLFLLLKNRRESSDFSIASAVIFDLGEGWGENKDKSHSHTPLAHTL